MMKTLFLKTIRCFITTWTATVLVCGMAYANDGADLVRGYIESAIDPHTSLDFEDLVAKAEREGNVCVIIELRLPTELGASGEKIQASKVSRKAISKTQKKVVSEMLSYGVRSIKRFKTIPFMAMEVDAEALEVLRSLPEVADIGEDVAVPPSLIDSISTIGADQARAEGHSGAGQTIAILDTGIDRNHPFLRGRVVAEACFSMTADSGRYTTVCPNGQMEQFGSRTAVPCSANGCDHGTHVAGIAAGNGPDISGVATNATIIAVQVFSQLNDPDMCLQQDSEAPCARTFASDYLRGLEYVYELRDQFNISAVNLSLGGGHFQSQCELDPNLDSQANSVNQAVDNLLSANVATIAASGNTSIDPTTGMHIQGIGFPACLSNVISVGATDRFDNVADFSQSLPDLDLLAPGSEIVSSIPGGGFQFMAGTSMAAPHVAGTWAVLKSKKPNASVSEILSALKITGMPITDWRNGFTASRIQTDAALDSLSEDGSPPPTVSVTPLDQLSPVGTIPEATPVFQWGAVQDATWYYLYVRDAANNVVVSNFVDPFQAGCMNGNGVCSAVENIAVAAGGHHWWIAAGNDAGYEWSEGASFVSAGVSTDQ